MPSEWFVRAQAYERDWGLKRLAVDGKEYIDLRREFFADDAAEYEAFLNHVASRRVLEVGCGPAPITLTWPASSITIIEPLWDAYAPHLAPLPPYVDVISQRGEDTLLAMDGIFNGAIVCRNCIDHTDTPIDLLTRLLAAAAPGCYVLFWSAYKYIAPDSGHRSYADNEDDVRRWFQPDFDIIREVHCHPAEHTRDWGCLARRKAAKI